MCEASSVPGSSRLRMTTPMPWLRAWMATIADSSSRVMPSSRRRRRAMSASSGSACGSARPRLDDRHLAAEPAVGQRQFESHRPGADDHQMGQLAGVVEDRLGGEIGHRRAGPECRAAPAGAPVAMTKRRALISVSPTFSVLGSAKLPTPLQQIDALRPRAWPGRLRRVPRPMISAIWSWTLRKLTLAGSPNTPNGAAGAAGRGLVGRRGEGPQRQCPGLEAHAAGVAAFDDRRRWRRAGGPPAPRQARTLPRR